MKIEILDAAEDDLLTGYQFYEDCQPGLGDYFLDSLYADIDSLAYYGGIHRIVHGYHRLLAKRFPFAIYYSSTPDLVSIIAVLDCRIDPDRTRERLK